MYAILFRSVHFDILGRTGPIPVFLSCTIMPIWEPCFFDYTDHYTECVKGHSFGRIFLIPLR